MVEVEEQLLHLRKVIDTMPAPEHFTIPTLAIALRTCLRGLANAYDMNIKLAKKVVELEMRIEYKKFD